MIKREVGLNNSRAFNVTTDEPLYNNYLALAYAIKGIDINGKTKFLDATKICRAFKLYDKCEVSKQKENKNSKNKSKINTKESYTDIQIKNIETGEIEKFENTKEACEATGLSTATIWRAISKNDLIHKKLSITAKKSDYKYRAKFDIIATNIETGEAKKFKRLSEASEGIGLSQTYISNLNSTGSISSDGWKIEYRGI